MMERWWRRERVKRKDLKDLRGGGDSDDSYGRRRSRIQFLSVCVCDS